MNVNGTALLDMPRVEVLAAELVRGECELLVQTVRQTTGCSTCSAVGAMQDRPAVTARDLLFGGVPVVISRHKRGFSCRHALCEQNRGPKSIRRSRPGRR